MILSPITKALAETAGIGSLCIAFPFFIIWIAGKLGTHTDRAIDERTLGEWPHVPPELRLHHNGLIVDHFGGDTR